MKRARTLGSIGSLAAMVGACTPDSTAFHDDPAPDPAPAVAPEGLAAVPDVTLAGCPGDSPSCAGPYDVEHTSLSYTIGASPETVSLCADLGHAVAMAFENGNGGQLRLDAFLPQDGQDWPGGLQPLFVLGPGNGQHYEQYDDLLDHLASLGVIAVSVDIPETSTVARRADVIQCALRHVLDDPSLAPHVDLDHLVLSGHSRGGEAVVRVANRLADSTNALETSVDVAAVVSIAPSSQCHNGSSSCGFNDPQGNPLPVADQATLVASTHLADDAAKAFMVIQGSNDGDIDGQGLTLFDLASSEYPSDQLHANPFDPTVDVMRKAMVWVFNVEHGLWGGDIMAISSPRAELLARAYIGAFVRWHALGEHEMLRYFENNRTPPFCVAWPAACDETFDAPSVFTEYVEGNHDGAYRFVVHDFTQAWNPRPPGVMVPAPGDALSALTNVGGKRVGGALGLEWDEDPEDVEIRLDASLDGTRYDVLSLRVGVVPGSTSCTVPSPAFDVMVGLGSEVNGMQVTAEVAASDYAHLRHPDCADAFGTQPHAQTVRVPLVDFEGVDLQHIRIIRVRIDPATAGPPAQLFIDGVELVENATYCGNGEREPHESCDGEDLAGMGCGDFGFVGGLLACDDNCRFDTDACDMCGNGVLDPGEACEPGIPPTGLDCADFGFAMGDLSCEASCTVIGTTTCHGGIANDSPGSYADCLTPAQRMDCEAAGPTACAAMFGHLDCVGGPCRPTDPSDRDLGSLLDWFNQDGGEFHPDGSYRDADGGLYYCNDVGEPRVCADEDGWGVCRRCDDAGGPNDTLLGCPCSESDDCESFAVADPPMSCWGAEFGPGVGTCWDVSDGPPAWQCAESVCGQVPYWGDDEMYCEHYASQAACQPLYACDGADSTICANEGLVCHPTNNGCTTECQADAHCSEVLGWPADYCCVNDRCEQVLGGC